MNGEASPKSPLRVIIVGSGSALPDPLRANPSIAVAVEEEILLFDCGERATVNLVRSGINPNRINHLFFSHLHWDHIADFNYLVMTTWNSGRPVPLRVFGPSGTRAMTEGMLSFHALDVEFVRRLVESLPEHICDRPPSEAPLEVKEFDAGTVLETDRFRVTAAEVVHLETLDFSKTCYAFRIDTEYGSVAISGDTEPCDSMIELARGVDLLVHEASFLEETLVFRKMRGHSGPRGAGRVAREAGAKKLVLTHLGPYDSFPAAREMAGMYYDMSHGPEVWSKILREASQEFPGPVILGQDCLELSV